MASTIMMWQAVMKNFVKALDANSESFLYLRQKFPENEKTISQKLEEIEDEILNLDEKRQSNLDLEKRIVASLVFYSIVFYILGSAILILYYYPSSTWSQCFLLLLPLIVFPFGIFGLKKLLHTYFLDRVEQMDRNLKALHKKKRKLLDEVMEKETYKKAKEILSRYDPLRFHQLDSQQQRISSSRPISNDMEVTRRIVPSSSNNSIRPSLPPQMARQPPPATMSSNILTRPTMGPPQTILRPNMGPAQQIRPQFPGPISHITPRLPRPILPRERSVVDRMFDALVGDGPDKRYALICMRCASHNGMSLAEEFPFLSFRCCYCGFVNPPRRQRTSAPVVPYLDNSSSCPPTPDTISEAGENETDNTNKTDENIDNEETSNQPNDSQGNKSTTDKQESDCSAPSEEIEKSSDDAPLDAQENNST